MENLAKAYGDSFKTSSKFITQKNGIGEIFTPKNLNFSQTINDHLLGKTRLGVAPEIKGQEDKILFGGIDIDCKDLPTEEKYKMALSLQNNLFEEYRLNALIEQSKSKGFHIFIFFSVPQKRDYIQNLLEKVVTKVTGKKIANGVIEIFPKGKKGNAMFLPYFGMFQDENTLNEEFFELKKSCFVEGENMEAITNPLTRIKNSMQVNSSMLLFQESLSKYPDCIRKVALNWKDGERNSLTMAIAGVLKKVAKVSVDEAINVITEIAQFNRDEELLGRIATVESTYKNEDVAGCSIMKGENSNISLSTIVCDSDCKIPESNISIKAKVRRIQASEEIKGNAKKDKISELIISELLKIGKIYKANSLYYLFTTNEKKLICISDDPLELRALFTQDYIKKLYETKDITFSVDFRMADFAVFALKTAENKKEENELKKIFSTMIKIQNEFTLKDDVLYILLKDFVKDPVYKNQRFTPAELYQKFKLKADEHGLLRPFEVVYKNPKAVSTRLKNIKDNIKDEILIHYKKGHGNQYYFSFKLVDESEYQESLI